MKEIRFNNKLRKYISASDILYQMNYKGYWEFITQEEFYKLVNISKCFSERKLEREIFKLYAKKNDYNNAISRNWFRF